MPEKNMLKKAVSGLLAELEFVGKPLTWNRRVAEVVQVVHLQIDKYASESSASFTTNNLGLCLPEVHAITWGRDEPCSYLDVDCYPRFRIGYLLAGESIKHLDKWWMIGEGSASGMKEALAVLADLGIPYLDRHSTLVEMYCVATSLKSRMQVADKIYLAVMSHLLGEESERDSLFRELPSSRAVSWRPRIVEVLGRIGLQTNTYL